MNLWNTVQSESNYTQKNHTMWNSNYMMLKSMNKLIYVDGN